MIFLDNTKTITPFIEIDPCFLVLKDRSIHFLGDKKLDGVEYSYFKENSDLYIDLMGKMTVPGFIDIHTHGALGKDYSTFPELLTSDSIFRASRGLTGFLPTIGTFVGPEQILRSSEKIINLIASGLPGAKALGVNLEAPFLYPPYAGAGGKEFCTYEVDLVYLEKAKKIMGDYFKIMTISPELGNSMEAIRYLRENNVIPSIGHTAADFNTLDKAIRNGANLVTHIYNTTLVPEQNMPGVFIPGVNEYFLMRNDVMAEIICDTKGNHISPLVLKIIIKCKGIDNIIMITDSLISPGAKSKQFKTPDGRDFIVKDGVNIQLPNQLSGSAMTMDLCIKSILEHTDIEFKEAIQMCTYNPAKILSMEHIKGSIEVGKDADIVITDRELKIYMTIVEGKIIYNELK